MCYDPDYTGNEEYTHRGLNETSPCIDNLYYLEEYELWAEMDQSNKLYDKAFALMKEAHDEKGDWISQLVR